MIKHDSDSFELENDLKCSDAGLSLRAAKSEDEPLLLEIYAGTRLEELKSVPWDDNQKRAFFKTQFDARQQQYRDVYRRSIDYIILQRGQPIGRILIENREHYVALVDIALLPEHQKAGLGTLLMEALLRKAANQDSMIGLHVLKTSAAVRFYERLEFRISGDDGTYLEMIWKPAH
jgi:GNAT superfamily N-acetyltransferase